MLLIILYTRPVPLILTLTAAYKVNEEVSVSLISNVHPVSWISQSTHKVREEVMYS